MTTRVVIPEGLAIAYNLAADRNGAAELVVNVAVTVLPDAEGVELVTEAGEVLMGVSVGQRLIDFADVAERAHA